MKLGTGRAHSTKYLVLILVGVVIAVVVTTSAVASFKWTALAMIGLVGLLPTLVIRPPRLYGFAVYLTLLMIERSGKSIDKYFIDSSILLDLYGNPPSSDVAILIWPSDLVFFILIASWLLRIMAGGSSAHIPKLGYLMFVFIIWAMLSSIFKAEIFYFSLGELIRFIKLFLLFVYVSNAVDSVRLVRNITSILLCLLAVQAVITLPSFALQTSDHPLSFLFESSTVGTTALEFDNVKPIGEEEESGIRASGTLGGAVLLALYLEFLIPLAFTAFWMAKRKAQRLIYGALFLLGMGAFFVTFSRSALVGLLVGLLVSKLLLYRRGLITSKTIVMVAYTGVLLALMSPPFIYDYMTTRPTNFLRRFPLMEKAAVMIAENPVLGVGLNNHTAAKRQRFVPSERGEEDNPTHNHYLVLGSEVGVIGLSLLVAFYLFVLRDAVRRSDTEEPVLQLFSIAAVGAFTALYIHLLGDNFSGHAPRSMYFFFAGIIAAMHRLGAEKSVARPLLMGAPLSPAPLELAAGGRGLTQRRSPKAPSKLE